MSGLAAYLYVLRFFYLKIPFGGTDFIASDSLAERKWKIYFKFIVLFRSFSLGYKALE